MTILSNLVNVNVQLRTVLSNAQQSKVLHSLNKALRTAHRDRITNLCVDP